MKKLKSSLVNMVVVLTLIAIVAGGLLAYVNSITQPQIKQIEEENLKKGIKEVLGVNENETLEYKADTIYKEGKKPQAGEKVKEDDIQFVIYKTEKGTAVSSKENGFGGPLTVLVGFDSEGTIKGYKVLKHSETPGLGAKADKWFQDKGEDGKRGKGIIGKNPGSHQLSVSKDGGEIDAITASTITSRAFLLAVQNAYDEIYGKNENQASAKE